MTRRLTKTKQRQGRYTLARKYVGDTRGRRMTMGAGKFGRWLKKAGKSLWKGVKKVGKFAVKNKLLSKGAALAATTYPELLPAVPILKALGLGKCKGKRCTMKKPCKTCVKKLMMVSNHQGKGLRLTGAGVSVYSPKPKRKVKRKVKKKGKGINP